MRFTEPDNDPYSDFDTDDFLDSEEFASAQDEVGAYMDRVQVATIANIAREHPQHQRILFSVLHKLKQAGRVYWDEWRPLPTVIHAGDRRTPHFEVDWDTARHRSWALKERV